MLTSRNKIFYVVEKVINQKFYDCLPELIEVLEKYKDSFVHLLRNDQQNQNDRNLIQGATQVPISISGIPQKIFLNSDFIRQSILLSDLFNLNEMTSVELLLCGEAESATNPEMDRGLIAVLKYYESQKTMVDSLRLLLIGKLTINTDACISKEIANYLNAFIEGLLQNGLYKQILKEIQRLNIDSEINMLEDKEALGSTKHRRQFFVTYEGIRSVLAECILILSQLSPPSAEDVVFLVTTIRQIYNYSNEDVKKESVQYGSIKKKFIDNCFVHLLMATFNILNPNSEEGGGLSNSMDNTCNSPFVSEDFQKSIFDLLHSNYSPIVNQDLNIQKSLVQKFDEIVFLTLMVSSQKSAHLKQDRNINFGYQRSLNHGDFDNFSEYDPSSPDLATVFSCFQFMLEIIAVNNFHETDLWLISTHNLITDIIVYMPKLIKDLRAEVFRNSTTGSYFASLLEVIEYLYGGVNPNNFDVSNYSVLSSLAIEYWSPLDDNVSANIGMLQISDSFGDSHIRSHKSYKNAPLFKFIRDSGDLVENPLIFIHYVAMLRGLCCNEQIARYVYCLLNNNLTRSQTKTITWEWFASSLAKHVQFLRSSAHNHQSPHKTMPTFELNGLLAVLQLIKQVSTMSPIVSSSMVNDSTLTLRSSMIELLSCRVPESLKAELLNCLSVFCQQPEHVRPIWDSLLVSKVITRSSDYTNSSIQIELEIVEPRSAEYSITRAFINFMVTVTPHLVRDIIQTDNNPDQFNLSTMSIPSDHSTMDSLTNVVQMVTESVFLKYSMRTYRNAEEKFQIAESFLKLCYESIELFLNQIGSIRGTKGKVSWCQYDPGFFIITQLFTDSQFFKTVVAIIDDGYSQMTDALNNVTYGPKSLSVEGLRSLRQSIYYSIDLLGLLLQNESIVLPLMRDLMSKTRIDTSRASSPFYRNRSIVMVACSRLLMTSSVSQRFLNNLMRYVSLMEECECLSQKSLEIFHYCSKSVSNHADIMLQFARKNLKPTDVDLISLFVNCIDKYGDIPDGVVDHFDDNHSIRLFFNDHPFNTPRTVTLQILISCLQQPTPNLGQYLMGFSCDSIQSVRRTALQAAGVGDFPRTCLHSLLNLIQRLSNDLLSSQCMDSDSCESSTLASFYINMINLSLAYHTLFLLASNADTSVAVLRFIRSNYEFIFNQIDLLLFDTFRFVDRPHLRSVVWNQKSWLLKIIAIEIRTCSVSQQKAYVTKLLSLLFGDDLLPPIQNASRIESWFSSRSLAGTDINVGILYRLFNDLDITEPEYVCDFSSRKFKADVLKEYLAQSVEHSYLGGGCVPLISVQKFARLIYTDLTSAVSSEEELQALKQEIDAIGRMISKWNTNSVWLQLGKGPAVDGWRQLVEMLMVSVECTGDDCVNRLAKRRQIVRILEALMDGALSSGTPTSLVASASRTCLILTAVVSGTLVNINSDAEGVLAEFLMPNDYSRRRPLRYSDELREWLRPILRRALDCILRTSADRQQGTRIKWYGVLGHLLQLVTHLLSSVSGDEIRCLRTDCLQMLGADGSLYSTVCRDAVSSNIHLVLTALTIIDCMTAIDEADGITSAGTAGRLLQFIVSHGYLQHLAESVVRDITAVDIDMHKCDPSVNNGTKYDSSTQSSHFYIYQSKMSLFCRLSATASGTRMLVQTGLLSALGKSEVLRQPLLNDDSLSVVMVMVDLATNMMASSGADCSIDYNHTRDIIIFADILIGNLSVLFQKQPASSDMLRDLIRIGNLFVLLVPALGRSESLLRADLVTSAMDKVRQGTAILLLHCLTGMVVPIDLMTQLLYAQLLSTLMMSAAGIVSTGLADDSRKCTFFSASTDGVINWRSNWSGLITRINQSVSAGNRPPLTTLVILIHKALEQLDCISQKMHCFLINDPLDFTFLKDDERLDVEDRLSAMSTDQLHQLWNSIFDSTTTGGNHNMLELWTIDDRFVDPLVSATTSDCMLRDLCVIHNRLSNVAYSLIDSLEACCFLLWSHVLAYRPAVCGNDYNQSLCDEVGLHPMQRLQKMRQSKLEVIDDGAVSENDVSKCVDEDLLNKILVTIEHMSDCCQRPRVFCKTIIHRLVKIIKLNQ